MLKKTAAILSCTLALLTAGCGFLDPLNKAAETSAPEEPVRSETAAPDPAVPNVPVDYMPVIPEGKNSWTECPYINTQWLQDTNGQRVTAVGVDNTLNPPACVFWSYPEDPQATILVRTFDNPQLAIDMVNWAAPIDTTDPAKEPAGWDGGRFGSEDRSLYAVSKGSTAVVVFSNQGQSYKAQQIAEKVIGNLGL